MYANYWSVGTDLINISWKNIEKIASSTSRGCSEQTLSKIG